MPLRKVPDVLEKICGSMGKCTTFSATNVSGDMRRLRGLQGRVQESQGTLETLSGHLSINQMITRMCTHHHYQISLEVDPKDNQSRFEVAQRYREHLKQVSSDRSLEEWLQAIVLWVVGLSFEGKTLGFYELSFRV